MYRAKLGNIPYVFYDQEIDGASKNSICSRSYASRRRGKFRPSLSATTEPSLGEILASSLIRWPTPPRPGAAMKFLPLAEDAGLMQELTHWCSPRRCPVRRMARFRSQHDHVVNITTRTLRRRVHELVTQLLTQHNLPGSALIIEITETSIITDSLAPSGHRIVERNRHRRVD